MDELYKLTPLPKVDKTPEYQPLLDTNERYLMTFPTLMRWEPRGPRHRSILIRILKPRRCELGRNDDSNGDLTFEGYTHITAVERKGSVPEVDQDFRIGKLERQLSAMKRRVRHPYLLLDFPIRQLRSTKDIGVESDPTPLVFDRIFPLCDRLGVPIIGPITGRNKLDRILMGEYVLRRMLSHIIGEKYIPYSELRVPRRRYRRLPPTFTI